VNEGQWSRPSDDVGDRARVGKHPRERLGKLYPTSLPFGERRSQIQARGVAQPFAAQHGRALEGIMQASEVAKQRREAALVPAPP